MTSFYVPFWKYPFGSLSKASLKIRPSLPGAFIVFISGPDPIPENKPATAPTTAMTAMAISKTEVSFFSSSLILIR
ncbi:hypothetical protein IGI04_024922 [Brassica rapa subsp. trilocularis]|uniref:Uncharacterized protein n=1 Tax=Brassica rapa subsp. trilocularis TaxID=1813537 RepID=A0ABQ7M841_BRACM|nr:hypothetical protein IGI04_024922 [Brassica rapa subsp. trilocularis]